MMSKQCRTLILMLLVCLVGVCSSWGAHADDPPASQQVSLTAQQRACSHPANSCYHDQGTYYALYNDTKHKRIVYDSLYCHACDTYVNYDEDVYYEKHVPDTYGNCTLCTYEPEEYPDVRISLKADTSSPQVGDTVVVVATITGGSGDFKCGWEAYCDDKFQDGLAYGDATLATRTYHLKITREGSWEVICGVIDEETGKRVNKSKFFAVGTTGPSEPDECSHSDLSYLETKFSYRHIDDDYHERTTTRIWKCNDCGETVQQATKEETSHDYDDETGICPCGHACPHHGFWSRDLIEAESYEASNDTSHLVIGIYRKWCWDCGAYFGDLYEAHEYEPHEYNSKNVCKQCGYTKSSCPHTSCHEEYYLDYDIVDETYHEASWGVSIEVCDDCGNTVKVNEDEYLPVFEAHELTTIDGKQLCAKCGYSPDNNTPSKTWWVDGSYYRSDADCGYYCSFWVDTDQDMDDDDTIGSYVEQISISVTYQGKAYKDCYFTELGSHYRNYIIQDPIGGFKDDVIVTCTFRVDGKDYSRTLVLKANSHDVTSGLQVQLSVTPTTDAGLVANAPFRVQADVSKGSGSYQHVFTIQSEREEWTFRTGAANTCTFTPPEDGLYVISVQVSDATNESLAGKEYTTATIGEAVEVQPPAVLEAGLYSTSNGAFNRGARYGFRANYSFWVFATESTHEVYAKLNGISLNDGQALPLGGSQEGHLYYLAKGYVAEGENTVVFTARGAANPVKTTFYGITKVTEHTQYIVRDQAELLNMPQTGARSGVKLEVNTPVTVRGKIEVSPAQNFWYVQVNGKNYFLPVSDLGEQPEALQLTAEIQCETDSITMYSSVPLTAAVDGGSGRYFYNWTAICGDQSIIVNRQDATLSLEPTTVGDWTVTLTVTDDSQQVAQDVKIIHVTESPVVPLDVTIELDPLEGYLFKTQLNASITIQGGSGQYRTVCEVFYYSEPEVTYTNDGQSFSVEYTPTYSGIHTLRVTVTDRESGETIVKDDYFSIKPPQCDLYHSCSYRAMSPDILGEGNILSYKEITVDRKGNATATVDCNWCYLEWLVYISRDELLPVVQTEDDFSLNAGFVSKQLEGSKVVLHVDHDLYITSYCDMSEVILDVDGDIIVDVNSKEMLKLNVINAKNLIVRGKSKVEYRDKGVVNVGDTKLKVQDTAQVTLMGHVEFKNIVVEDDATLIVDKDLWAGDAEFDYFTTFSVMDGTAYFTDLKWKCTSTQHAHVVISGKLHVDSHSIDITKLELPNDRELEDCLKCDSLERLHGVYHQGVDIGGLARMLQDLMQHSNQRMREAALLEKEAEYREELRDAANAFNINGQSLVSVGGRSIDLDDTTIREDIAAVMMMIADEENGTGFFTDTITTKFHKKLTINMGTWGTDLKGEFTYKGRTYKYSCRLDGIAVNAGKTTVYSGSTSVLIDGQYCGAVYSITSNDKTVADALNELIDTSKEMVHYDLDRAVEFVTQEIEAICGVTFRTEARIVKELIAIYFDDGIIDYNERKHELTIDWGKFKESREKMKEAIAEDEAKLNSFLRHTR